MWFKRLFKKPYHPNPAINALYHSKKTLPPKVSEIIPLLPKLGEVYQEGAAYLLHKVLLSQIKAYDEQYGSSVLDEIDEEKSTEMVQILTRLMIFYYFKALSRIFPEDPYPSVLANALHFEIYNVMPEKESYIAYLSYKNQNFDDAEMAPAYKFGNDIAAIVAIPDLSFCMMITQQAAVILDISQKLMRWILFDEPMAPETS